MVGKASNRSVLGLKPTDKVYRAFYDTRRSLLYFNQLKEITGLSDSSLANVLRKLRESNEIEQIKEKSNTFYKLKDFGLRKIYFTLFDYQRFENLSSSVKIPLRRFLSEMPRCVCFVILFGSVARQQVREESDIDILVVLHEFGNRKLQTEYENTLRDEIESLRERVSAISIYPVSVIYTDIDDFVNTDDRLVTEARNTGFCIGGNLEYYEVMLENGWESQPVALR